MAKGIIRFCYRKVIDASSGKQWDKNVFESSYKEFRMQSQFYNQEKKYNTFSELIGNVPSSEKLHFSEDFEGENCIPEKYSSRSLF